MQSKLLVKALKMMERTVNAPCVQVPSTGARCVGRSAALHVLAMMESLEPRVTEISEIIDLVKTLTSVRRHLR